MTFEAGQKVKHRASGELGIFLSNCQDGTHGNVSWGANANSDIELACLEPAGDQPDTPPKEPGPTVTIEASVNGERQTLRVLRRQGLGLVCAGDNGVHFVMEPNAANAAKFRELYDAFG